MTFSRYHEVAKLIAPQKKEGRNQLRYFHRRDRTNLVALKGN